MNRCFNQEFTPNWTIHRLFSWNRRKFLKKVFNQFQGMYIAKYNEAVRFIALYMETVA